MVNTTRQERSGTSPFTRKVRVGAHAAVQCPHAAAEAGRER